VTDETRRISVQGTGRVRLRPDLARLRLGCFAEHDRAAVAFDACSSATGAVLAALREAGAGDDYLPAPVEVGDQEVAASVNVVFEIGDEDAT